MEQILLAVVQPRERKQLTKERFEFRALQSVAWLEDSSFKQTFRVNRSGFEKLYREIGPHLKEGGTRYAISIETKLFVTLRHLAQGSYQLSVGNEVHGSVSQSSVSNILAEVLDVMNFSFCQKYITFPSFSRMKTIAVEFLRQCGIPNVIGLIDGSHIRIAIGPKTVDPNYPEFVYVNRKQFHSINAMIICDHEYRITYVNAKYPGSAHDSFVWKHSPIREYLLQNYCHENVWLLGDSGYPLEPVLITPIDHPTRNADELFNDVQRSCRSGVERCIGVLKARWRCLKEERGLHYHPTKVGKIINACVALHNFCLEMDDDYMNIVGDDDPADMSDPDPDVQESDLFVMGQAMQTGIINYLMQTRRQP